MTDSNGLYYMRARYYNPDIRRFINRDVVQGTIGNGLSLNRFAYVNGNPVSYVDPFGLSADSDSYLSRGYSGMDGAIPYQNLDSYYSTVEVMRFWMPDEYAVAWFQAGGMAGPYSIGTAPIGYVSGWAADVGIGILERLGIKKASEVVGKGMSNPKVKEAAAKGRQMHKAYDYGSGVKKEQSLPSRKRMDGYDAENKVIHELKPNNPNAIKKGMKQLDGYIDEANEEYGPGHLGKLHTYDE
jgi:RHS repeat-associated protein